MVYLKKKRIGGREYYYLTKSIRLPDGKVKTLQKLVPKGIDTKEFEDFFNQKKKEVYTKVAVQNYRTDSIFTEDKFRKIEGIRVDYRNLLRKLSKSQIKDIFDRFTANFTYESNAIEGNSLTLKDVSIVIFENIIPTGKELREIYETRNSREVVGLIVKKRFRINHRDILRMHKLLMRDIPTAPGYKKLPNYIIGKKVETTPPDKVEEEMSSLIELVNENPEKLHPLQLSADFHGRFEKIHPFEDGNGRVGRFLSNVILINKGYPPLIIRKSQRLSYLKALDDFDRGYKANLERLFLEKFEDTYNKFFEAYVRYAKQNRNST